MVAQQVINLENIYLDRNTQAGKPSTPEEWVKNTGQQYHRQQQQMRRLSDDLQVSQSNATV